MTQLRALVLAGVPVEGGGQNKDGGCGSDEERKRKEEGEERKSIIREEGAQILLHGFAALGSWRVFCLSCSNQNLV